MLRGRPDVLRAEGGVDISRGEGKADVQLILVGLAVGSNE